MAISALATMSFSIKTLSSTLFRKFLIFKFFENLLISKLRSAPNIETLIFLSGLLEASLSEKIIIAPNWSGHIDFLNKISYRNRVCMIIWVLVF